LLDNLAMKSGKDTKDATSDVVSFSWARTVSHYLFFGVGLGDIFFLKTTSCTADGSFDPFVVALLGVVVCRSQSVAMMVGLTCLDTIACSFFAKRVDYPATHSWLAFRMAFVAPSPEREEAFFVYDSGPCPPHKQNH
jgi:hypothetical protein